MRVAILFAIRYNTFNTLSRVLKIPRKGTNADNERTRKYGALLIAWCAKGIIGVIQ